jgi:PKD repeat protein
MIRNLYLSLLAAFITFQASAQVVVFSDDFESGLDNWTVTGLWNTTTSEAFSPTNSFTDSPGGNYPDVFSSSATLAVDIDLTSALDADVKMMALVDLETGFDYVYLDASTDGGGDWTNIYVFNGEGFFDWTEYAIPLGAFVGSPTVRLRFRFESDAAYNVDGLYLDDIKVTTYNIDASPPLILHEPTNLYEGTLGANTLEAELIDASGIASTTLYYNTDGGAYTAVTGINVVGDLYAYEIPELAPGTWVSYYIEAIDDFFAPNTATSPIYEIIAGNYISYDDGVIDFVADIGTTSLTGYVSAAVKVTLTGETDLVTAIIQNYTDYMRSNDDIQFHIWADDGFGFPGDDLITPFYVTPEPTLDEPNRGTRVDLRGIPELEGIFGDVFIGYTVPGGLAWVSYTSTLVTNRSYVQTGFGWTQLVGDFHFRAVTSELTGAPEALYSYTAAAEPTINFTDLSTNEPTSWFWDFGDGATSTLENPVHTFLSNGSFNVCLTASNAIAGDTYCEFVVIDAYAVPIANFSFTGDPDVAFTDLSLNTPTSWFWDFNDGATSTLQNPTHTFTEDGTFSVCLTATNSEGDAIVCKDVVIGNTPKIPVVDFSYSISGTNVTFTDLSSNTPTYWDWDFGDGGSSTDQNPAHFYATPTAFTVCLTAGNVAGENFTCKLINFNSIHSTEPILFSIQPNPANQFIQIVTTENGTAEILNNLGQKVETINVSTNTPINVSLLPEGIYFIQLHVNDKIGTQAFVIQH